MRRSLVNRLIDDYHVTLFLGVMFIASGLLSAITEVIEVYTDLEFEFFHSMIFLGIFNCGMALMFVILGARNIEVGEEAAGTTHHPEADARLAALEKRVQELEQRLGETS